MAPHIRADDLKLAHELCGRYREWLPAAAQAPAPVTAIGGGHANRSILLRGAAADYVLRIGATPPPEGVDRAREAQLAALAAKHAVAPTLLYSDAARGLLITRHTGSALSAAPDPQETAALLRAIHAIPLPAPIAADPLDSAASLAGYRARLGPGSATRALLRTGEARLGECAALLQNHPSPPVLCHNDLLPPNLRRRAGKLLALDWEYACAGDARYDLAVATAAMTPVRAQAVLAAYLGQRPAVAEATALAAQRTCYLAIASAWYELCSDDAGLQAAALAALAADLHAAGVEEAPRDVG